MNGVRTMVIELTQDNFKKEVLESDVPVLVDFWARWCMPCLRTAPILEELALEVGDRAKVAKLDVDAIYQIADEYEIISIPTLTVFVNGEIKEQVIGVKSKQEMIRLLGL